MLGTGLSGLVFGLAVLGQGLMPFWLALSILGLGFLFCWLYARHAARVAHPLLDLSLMRIATFRASVVGGALFRIAMGATGFLLPLLFQIGFGLTAFASGMLTFVTAIGAFLMKFTAAPILGRFGFRNVLIANALISTVFVFGFALFTSATPHAVILVVLFVAGFFRSLQFSAVNTLVYADIWPPSMSQATSFSSAAHQLSLSLGVAAAALTLEAEQILRGNSAILVDDFVTAFLVVGVIGALSAVIFWRLPDDAGSELTGKVEESAGPADPAAGARSARSGPSRQHRNLSPCSAGSGRSIAAGTTHSIGRKACGKRINRESGRPASDHRFEPARAPQRPQRGAVRGAALCAAARAI